MGKTYDQAPDEVRERIGALIRKFHPDLELVQLRVDLLMASTDVEDAHAVTLGGYPCLAVVKIVGPKERAKACGDAEIVIDRDAYEAMTGPQRDALLDHELYHLEIVRDKMGRPKRDDYQRPKLKMRKHDFNVGWFIEIARRHKENAFEVQQARAFAEEHGQLFFGFDAEMMSALKPTEDSVERERSPHVGNVTERILEQAQHDVPFQKMCREHGATVEIRTGDASVKINKDGIHAEPSQQQLDDATKLARKTGFLTRSALQRELKVHYNLACAIIDRLVAAKILGAEKDVGRFDWLDKPAEQTGAPTAAAA